MKEIKTKIWTVGKKAVHALPWNKCCCNAFRSENFTTFINFTRLQFGGKRFWENF